MKQFHTRIFCWISLLGLTLFGCDIINPEEEVPFYIKVETPLVKVHPGQNLTRAASVKDVWVDHNENFVGAYPAPVVIPIFPDDQIDYQLTGGINSFGLGSLRSPYPFWKSIEVDIPVGRGDTFTYQPVFEYFRVDSILTFAFEETFESSSTGLVNNLGTTNSVSLVKTPEEAYTGDFSGKASFDAIRTEMEFVTITGLTLPQRGNNNIFVEVTYKNDIPFTVNWLYTGSSFGTINNGIFYAPRDEWNTVYLDFNNEIRNVPVGNTRFFMILQASSGGAEGNIFFDNIRVIHFK